MAKERVVALQKISQWKAWFLAARPKTLPVSLPPIIVGTALASQVVDEINWLVVGFALLCSIGIQIGTNFVNDALDFKAGVDNVERLGSQRMTQGGFLSFKQVLSAGWLCYALAMVCGIPLIFVGGWPIALLLALSIACGYLYTGGPFPLAYLGISDLFVLIFFGWVSTGIVYYLQVGTVDFNCFLAATQIGLLAIVPHAINNLRDHLSDARAHKLTMAVRFGCQFARLEISFFSFVPFIMGFLWLKESTIWMTALPFLSFPFVIRNVQAIWQTEPGVIYNEFLAKSALCELLFGVFLAIGILL